MAGMAGNSWEWRLPLKYLRLTMVNSYCSWLPFIKATVNFITWQDGVRVFFSRQRARAPPHLRRLHKPTTIPGIWLAAFLGISRGVLFAVVVPRDLQLMVRELEIFFWLFGHNGERWNQWGTEISWRKLHVVVVLRVAMFSIPSSRIISFWRCL